MKIFLSVIFLILAIVFWRYLLHGVIGAALLGFIGSLFGEGWMLFGGLVGFLLGLSAARNNSENTAEISPFKQTEAPLETKRKSILRKTRDALVGFILLSIVVVGLAVSFAPEPKSISPLDVIGIFNPVKYLIKKWRK